MKIKKILIDKIGSIIKNSKTILVMIMLYRIQGRRNINKNTRLKKRSKNEAKIILRIKKLIKKGLEKKHKMKATV